MDLVGTPIVVTGGAGFIGSHVADRLVSIGAEVTVVDDLSVGRRDNLSDFEARGGQFVRGDVRDEGSIAPVLQGATVVVHMACDNLRASLGRPVHTHHVNATGSLVTALAAVAAGVRRFVYVSSAEAYGSARTTPMSEDHPLEPTTVYGAAKAAGELYAQSVMRTYGIEATVIRPFNSYGPREHAGGTSAEVIPKFVARIKAGLPPVICGDGSQTRYFTWVEESAVGIVLAAAAAELAGGAVNIAHGKGVSISEIADRLLAILDTPELRPLRDEPRPGDVEYHYADTTKARELLGFEARTEIQAGLERYVAWLDSAKPEDVSGAAVRNW
ncbi:MAG: NAD-dependent epimerase/dehydratase family protein [Gaiellaceae bacterium]